MGDMVIGIIFAVLGTARLLVVLRQPRKGWLYYYTSIFVSVDIVAIGGVAATS